MRSVVVIGGGVIGAACAYYLGKSGWKVTVIDRSEFGSGCSHANCGYVCPSHVLPLTTPGAIGMALRSMLLRNSAFSVRPRLSLGLWRWLYRFARRCNTRDMLAAGHVIQSLLQSSRQLYDELVQKEKIDCEWKSKGLLFVFQTEAAMHHYAETDRLLADAFGLKADRFDGPAVNDLEPALKPGLAGGWLYRGDAHLRPDRLMSSWRRVLESMGVEIRENCSLRGFAADGVRAMSAQTDAGAIRADAFVVATGAWTPLLNKQLGCRVPIQPGKGYSITMTRPSDCPTYPLIFEEHRVAVTPMRTGYRIGSTMEFAGYDTSINPRRLELLREGAKHYLKQPLGDQVTETWYGWRPMTPDSVPIIDRSPKMNNVLIAAGHNMLGLSMAPATGKLVAEMLDEGGTPHIDPVPYKVTRF